VHVNPFICATVPEAIRGLHHCKRRRTAECDPLLCPVLQVQKCSASSGEIRYDRANPLTIASAWTGANAGHSGSGKTLITTSLSPKRPLTISHRAASPCYRAPLRRSSSLARGIKLVKRRYRHPVPRNMVQCPNKEGCSRAEESPHRWPSPKRGWKNGPKSLFIGP
jgi:hypothetical protein